MCCTQTFLLKRGLEKDSLSLKTKPIWFTENSLSKNVLVPLARSPAQRWSMFFSSTTVLVFGICHYLLEHLSEVMYQGTTVFWCIKNLQMEPAVAFISEPRPILHLANDASCTAFFFLLLLALSDCSVCALLLLRGTIMSYKAFPKPHFYIVHIKPINVRPVWSQYFHI